MKSLAMVIRDDGYDKILTPLAFAYLASAEGVEVDMLFVNWSVRALTKEGARSLRVEGSHADQDAWVREQVAKAGLPSDIHEVLKALKETGCVRLYGCSLAATIFGVNDDNLIPEAEGIVGASWFLNDKMTQADHCQYF
ncbi:DsrE family protein [Thiohalomonas denitrificans]|uniref:Peroxiredoxin family protein n=1 Tax=Thiohalomonas denitrificans TaxID=415747 RepID=A0A1G5QER8_9GAMM|nr:DsrE family protein [Thiohalomonas denitrificans]SCZ60000.1 Peroxiredoxin family protein [Thiohalomonas denitrificans]